jgi:trans-aconitate methyltransferase
MYNDQVEFYNEIFRNNPTKWASAVARDEAAYFLLEETLSDKPESVLDYGCGNGHTLAFFKTKWPDAKYTGVDISDVALELAKERLPEGEFYQELPGKTKWDVIVIMGVAEHFVNPVHQLSALGKLLTPGGYIYLEVPNCIAYSPDKTEGYRKTDGGSDQEEWHWQRDTWEKAILTAGLLIVERYKGHAPEWQFIWILGNYDECSESESYL